MITTKLDRSIDWFVDSRQTCHNTEMRPWLVFLMEPRVTSESICGEIRGVQRENEVRRGQFILDGILRIGKS